MSSHLHLENVIAFESGLFEKTNRWFYRFDPRIKLGLLAAAIILNIGFAITELSAAVMIAGILALLWARPSGRTFLLFLAAPLFASLLTWVGFGAGFGETPAYEWGWLKLYQEGLIEGAEVFLRVYCDVVWLSLVFLTTPFSKVLGALRWFKVPGILIDTLALMYRYSFLLFDEFTRMKSAASCRGGISSRKNTMKTLSRIAALIFLRAFDRSERIYWAMFARGGGD